MQNCSTRNGRAVENKNIQLNRCSHFAVRTHFQIEKTPYFKGFDDFWSYSHSIVPTGFGVKSRSTLLIPSTSAVILFVIL